MVHIAQGGSATGTLNIHTNGTLIAAEITTGNVNGTSYLNLDGGVIPRFCQYSQFLHDIFVVNFYSGGITLDSQGFDITFPKAFRHLVLPLVV